MFSIIPDALIALEAEAAANPTGLAAWARDIIVDAQVLATGRPFEQIAVEAIMIVWFDDDATPAFRDFGHPIFQSVLAMRSELLNGPNRVAALEAKLATLARIDMLNRAKGTDAAIRALVTEKAARYPELGLSYGYIGNCDFGGRYDDRSFRVFTKVRDERGAYSINFGSFASWDAKSLGAMLVAIETDFDDWAQATLARIASGQYSQRALAA